MTPNAEEYLLISGLQHFVFCRRQWALIYIEATWADNALTVSGELLHTRTHNADLTEKRGDLLVTRSMPVLSHALRIQGVCDVVEFRRDDGGVPLAGRRGLWRPCPVEYKRGRPKSHDADRMQLCAQAICLEEMLGCPAVETAYLYYGETKRREAVALDAALRASVRAALAEMSGYYERRHTPRAKPSRACASCSLRVPCLPELPQSGRVDAYIRKALAEEPSCEGC
jgi:CRISPR-associated exonuclease Cas4